MGNSCSRSVHAKKAPLKVEELEKGRRMLKLREHLPARGHMSLVQLCLLNLAERPDLTERDVDAISHDLAQELLDLMVRLRTLNRANMAFFQSQKPWKLSLASFPGVRNDWVTALVGEHLLTLDLSSCEVDDGAMRAIAGCTGLQSLDMSKTHVTAAGFMCISGLLSLKRLRLSDCEELDGRAASSLGNLHHLELLDLSLCRHMALADLLPHLEHCTRMRHLDLSWCRCDGRAELGKLSVLRGLTALTSLNLSKARFDSATLPYLKLLTNLVSLNLSDFAFDTLALKRTNTRDGPRLQESELGILGALTNLTNLELRWCQVPSHLSWVPVAQLRSLARLDVSFVRAFDNSSLAPLTALRNLTYLNLDSTGVTNNALSACSALTKLSYLNLSDTRVEDAALTHLYHLSQLQGLDLSYSFITDLGVELLRELTRLTYLSIDSRLITDLGLKCLAPLTGIVSLDIYGCKMTHQGALCIAKLPRVTWLDASGGTLCDAGVAALGAMTQLTYLSVSQNEHITDDAMPALARLTNLRSLNLSGTKVTAARLPMLSSLAALTSLALYNTCAKPCTVWKMAAAWPEVLITGLPSSKPSIRTARL